MSTPLGIVLAQLILKGCIEIEETYEHIKKIMLIKAQSIENAKAILMAAGNAKALQELLSPLHIDEDLMKEVEEFAGTVLEVDLGSISK